MKQIFLLALISTALLAGCSSEHSNESPTTPLAAETDQATALDQAATSLAPLLADDDGSVGIARSNRHGSSYLNKLKTYLVLKSLEWGDSRPIEWFVSEDEYTQHNLSFPDGRQVLIDAIDGGLLDGTTVDIKRIFADGDFVIVHSQYFLFGLDEAGFDVFRFEDGKIVEHWDNLGLVVEDGDGTTQFNGPRRVRNRHQTEDNRALVTEFANNVLVGGEWSSWPQYFDEGEYIQHSVGVPSGTEFFEQFPDGFSFFSSVEFVHAEGNFVLTMSEGYPNPETGLSTAYYDLFRVKRGKIVEHWDVIQEIPPMDQWANDNGKW